MPQGQRDGGAGVRQGLPAVVCLPVPPPPPFLPSQVRDFAATLRSRDDDAFDRLLDYQATAYYLLFGKSTGKVNDYPDALLLWFLQVAYLRHTKHPMLDALRADFAVANEELGEISLSEFSKGVKDGSTSPVQLAMSKDYRLQGARKDVVRNFHTSLDISMEANYHEVATKTNATEVDHAEETLKAIRKLLHTDKKEAYETFDLEFTLTKNGKKSGRKVPSKQMPALSKKLTPFFEHAFDRNTVWDVKSDLDDMKARYFNVPPKRILRERSFSASGSASSDGAPAVPRRAGAPVGTRAGAAGAALAGSDDE